MKTGSLMARVLLAGACVFGAVRVVATAESVLPARTGLVAPGDDLTAADLAKIGEGLAPSLVRVEYTLQYDKGESPGSDLYSAWRRYAGGWGAYDGSSARGGDWDQYITEERPAEFAGYLIGPTKVITADPALHPRFIKEIGVRFGDKVVKATPSAYAKERGALFLELAEPLEGTKPLRFDGTKPGPYLAATYTERDGSWVVALGASQARAGVKTEGKGTERQFGGGEGIVVDRSGTPVGLWLGGVSKAEGAWKGSPERWPAYSVAEMDKMLADVERIAAGAIVRVSLGFRSPRSSGGGMAYGFDQYMARDADQDITQWHGSGVLVDDRTVLVLANFKPKTTGRLERIRVFTPSGEVKGTFEGTLKDYGGFLATLEQPVSGAARLYTGDITELRDRLLLKAEVTVVGEIRTGYYSRERIGGFYVGWRRQVLPSVSPTRASYSYSYMGSDQGSALNFLFTPEGELVCVPLAHREKVAMQDQWSSRWGAGQMTPGKYIDEVVKDRSKNLDTENRPVSEDEENRLAWLGVEMQPMDEDLARENNVIDQTRGGASGGMVTYVYPDSPAAKAGIEMGDIILRVHVEGQPKPIEVQLAGDFGFGSMMEQFWESIDQMPEEYMDQMPKPWGSVENPLVRALTDVGFGTAFKAEVFRNGKVELIDFEVEQGPAHYDSAKRFKSEAAGLTVRDLTYEVRRFFQLKDEDPGVVISKVERGEKAAVAGLKMYEIITAVNDTPVKSAADFEKAIAGGGEFRVNVKRRTTGRIVKIKLDPAKAEEK